MKIRGVFVPFEFTHAHTATVQVSLAKNMIFVRQECSLHLLYIYNHICVLWNSCTSINFSSMYSSSDCVPPLSCFQKLALRSCFLFVASYVLLYDMFFCMKNNFQQMHSSITCTSFWSEFFSVTFGVTLDLFFGVLRRVFEFLLVEME